MTKPLGYGLGAMQPGIRLVASCSPMDVIPPPLWEGFKKAIMESAKQWGLSVRLGEDDGSIREAGVRFWMMQRAHEIAAIDEAANRSE